MSLTVLMSHQVSLLEPVDLGQHERSKRHATHETRKGADARLSTRIRSSGCTAGSGV